MLWEEVDRRVLVVGIDTELGLMTCAWSRSGNTVRHSTPSSRDAGWDFWFQPMEAEGRDREQVGEDVTMGK